MNNDILVIDFETKDPYIALKLGAGWAYLYNLGDKSLFKPLGAAMKNSEGRVWYETDMDKICQEVMKHDELLAHNAVYDIGILYALMKDNPKQLTHLKNMPVHDTKILFKLYNNTLKSYSLDPLSKQFLNIPKGTDLLTEAVYKNDLYPYLKKEITAKAKSEKAGEVYIRTRPDDKKMLKWAYANMDVIQDADLKAMADYAISDISNTLDLYNYVIQHLDSSLIEKYSIMTHILISYRAKGVRIDVKRAKEVYFQLIPIVAEKCKALYDLLGTEVNINSSKEVPAALQSTGLICPLSASGAPSATTAWLEKQNNPVCNALIEARRYKKVQSDFVKKLIDIQEYTCPDGGDYGRVYPELNLFGAVTGRFSCTAPNLQQIPSRDPVTAALVRSIFIPEEGEQWFSRDFSNQEGRLQLHYAHKIRAEGAAELVEKFKQNPQLDMHQAVADMAEISRKEAKTLNLGLSYGMGNSKLGYSLGILTHEECALIESLQKQDKKPLKYLQDKLRTVKEIRDKYNTLAPYLNTLNTLCKDSLQSKGFLTTLGGRKTRIDPPYFMGDKKITFEYKALNKLIQGSAADQGIEAMIQCYKEGLPVLFPIHDSLEISGNAEQAQRVKEIMETCVELEVPSVADGSEIGASSWAEAK